MYCPYVGGVGQRRKP